ncbi:hypothetical protein E2C01_088389 [Portunus trituberculatus]|uniref:Uncharacterized protein n=1 Tax=Portunus trituberculatus TaxID=210409 RepID=A0A5B7JF96_PORTR|nr:hypothetical protein [Portunus trituberculatus]
MNAIINGVYSLSQAAQFKSLVIMCPCAAMLMERGPPCKAGQPGGVSGSHSSRSSYNNMVSERPVS